MNARAAHKLNVSIVKNPTPWLFSKDEDHLRIFTKIYKISCYQSTITLRKNNFEARNDTIYHIDQVIGFPRLILSTGVLLSRNSKEEKDIFGSTEGRLK